MGWQDKDQDGTTGCEEDLSVSLFWAILGGSFFGTLFIAGMVWYTGLTRESLAAFLR